MIWETFVNAMLVLIAGMLVWTVLLVIGARLGLTIISRNINLLRDIVNNHTTLLHEIKEWQITADGRLESIEHRLEKLDKAGV